MKVTIETKWGNQDLNINRDNIVSLISKINAYMYYYNYDAEKVAIMKADIGDMAIDQSITVNIDAVIEEISDIYMRSELLKEFIDETAKILGIDTIPCEEVEGYTEKYHNRYTFMKYYPVAVNTEVNFR